MVMADRKMHFNDGSIVDAMAMTFVRRKSGHSRLPALRLNEAFPEKQLCANGNDMRLISLSD